MAMFDVFKNLLGRKKKDSAPKKAPAPVMESIFVPDEKPEGRRGHKGQFERAVARRRFRNKIARKSRRINRKRAS